MAERVCTGFTCDPQGPCSDKSCDICWTDVLATNEATAVTIHKGSCEARYGNGTCDCGTRSGDVQPRRLAEIGGGAPVNLAKARKAAQRLTDVAFHNLDKETGEPIRPHFEIPANQNDDDIILTRALDELEKLRSEVASLDSPPFRPKALDELEDRGFERVNAPRLVRGVGGCGATNAAHACLLEPGHVGPHGFEETPSLGPAMASMPAHLYRCNAGVACDMLIGPCACGATHSDGDIILERTLDEGERRDEIAMTGRLSPNARKGEPAWRARVGMVVTETPTAEVPTVEILLIELGRRMAAEKIGRCSAHIDRDVIVEVYLSPPPEKAPALKK